MEPLFILQAGLVVVAQLFAGTMVLRWLCGRAESAAARIACALILGPAILCIELLLMGACFGSASYELIVLPWVVGGFVWLVRGCARGTLQVRLPHLLGYAGALLLIGGVLNLSVPPTHGDPGSNFAGYAKLYAHLGHVDPVAAEGLSIFGHFEYPPLLAANESLFFQIDTEAGSQMLGVMFALYLVALLLLAWSATGAGASPRVKLVSIGLLILLAVQPSTIQFATYAYAELPLVAALLWMLIEVGKLLGRGKARNSQFAGVLLAGLTLALTKQEGILLAIAVASVLPLILGWRKAWVPLVVATLASVWPIRIAALGLESGWLSSAVSEFSIEKLGRVPSAAEALLRETFAYESYPALGFATFAIVALGFALARAVQAKSARGAGLVLIGLGLHFAVYVLVFSVTSEEFEWHLHTASGRLAYHFIPYFILLTRTREQAVATA